MLRIALLTIFLATLRLTCEASEVPKVTALRAPENGIQPQAAVDSKGIVHMIYMKGDPKAADIFYVRREPGQTEFSEPVKVNTCPNSAMAIGTIRGPQIAVGKNGRVHVAWDGMGENAAAVPGARKDRNPLLYTRLNDAGTGFEPERNVITYAYGLDGGSSVAADPEGNVYVTWHALKPGNAEGEGNRAVFIARSTNEGKTFQRETEAISKPTGACGCCGMRAFADSRGDVLALYRAAYEMTNRDETLLISRDKGTTFQVAYAHPWQVSTCPMSSATLSESAGQILAAAETHGRVFFIRLDPATGRASAPVSPDRQAKHPVAVANEKGQTLLVWAEGTGWNKGGSVAWQIYDKDLNPTSDRGRRENLQVWSLPTAFAERDGAFTIVY